MLTAARFARTPTAHPLTAVVPQPASSTINPPPASQPPANLHPFAPSTLADLHALAPRTPVNIKLLAEELASHPDQSFVQTLLSSLRDGADIGF